MFTAHQIIAEQQSEKLHFFYVNNIRKGILIFDEDIDHICVENESSTFPLSSWVKAKNNLSATNSNQKVMNDKRQYNNN